MPAMRLRCPTFLAREEWKTIPWSIHSKDLMHHLLDHLSDIPGLLAQYDRLAQAPGSNSMLLSEISDQWTPFWTSVADLEHHLRRWKADLADSAGESSEFTAQGGFSGEHIFLISDKQVPIFRCQDLSTGEVISPSPLSYTDLEFAKAMCLYYTGMLIISLLDTRTEGGIQLHLKYDFACLICRSVPYFTLFIEGEIIWVLLPLQVAYSAFAEGGLERQWIGGIFQLVAETRRKAYQGLVAFTNGVLS